MVDYTFRSRFARPMAMVPVMVLTACLMVVNPAICKADSTYVLVEAKAYQISLPYPTQSISLDDSALLRGPACILPAGFEAACQLFGAEIIQRAFALSDASDTLMQTELGGTINTQFLHEYYEIPVADTGSGRQLVEYLQDSLGLFARLPAGIHYDDCLYDVVPVDPGQGDWMWYSWQAQYQGEWNPACWWTNMMHMPCAWGKHQGSSAIRIGILDAGVNRHIPDLDDRDWIGIDEFSWSHGTFVASIAMADWDGNGMAGLNRYCRGGTYKLSDYPDDAQHTQKLLAAGNSCQIINCSWHFADLQENPYDSPLFHRAVAELVKAGRVIFAAGGNRGMIDNASQCPANLPEVIAIAGYDTSGNRIEIGTKQSYLDFAFPGYLIKGALSDSTYGNGTATSFATPAASAVASMILSYADLLGYDVNDRDDIYYIMMASRDELAITGWNNETGWGVPRLDRSYMYLDPPNTLERLDITSGWDETTQGCSVTLNGVLEYNYGTYSATRHLLTRWVDIPNYYDLHGAWIRGSSSVSARDSGCVTEAFTGRVLEFNNDSCLIQACYYSGLPGGVTWPNPGDIQLRLSLLGERLIKAPLLSADLSNPSKATISWTDPNTNEQGQTFYRKIGNGSWSSIELGPNVTSREYPDTVASSYYYYKVRPYTDNQGETCSAVYTLKQPPRTPDNIHAEVLLGDPTILPLEKTTSVNPEDVPTNKVRVTWDASPNQPAGTLDKYIVQHGVKTCAWYPDPSNPGFYVWICDTTWTDEDVSLDCTDITLCLNLNTQYAIRVLAEDIYGDRNTVRPTQYVVTGNLDYCTIDIPVLDKPVIPEMYLLLQNRPNPFNASTVIEFGLPVEGNVRLEIYDVLGRRMCRLVDDFMPAGYHNVTWNGRDDGGVILASGMYFYRLTAEAYTKTKKMVLMK